MNILEQWSEYGIARSKVKGKNCINCNNNEFDIELIYDGDNRHLDFECVKCKAKFRLNNVYPKSIDYGEPTDKGMVVEDVKFSYGYDKKNEPEIIDPLPEGIKIDMKEIILKDTQITETDKSTAEVLKEWLKEIHKGDGHIKPEIIEEKEVFDMDGRTITEKDQDGKIQNIKRITRGEDKGGKDVD